MKLTACTMLACTLLLAGCAAGERSAAMSSIAPSVSTAAEPVITPDPASLLECAILPLQNTKKPPADYWTAYFENPSNPAAVDYARQFAMGLYNNDVDAVRAACQTAIPGLSMRVPRQTPPTR